MEVDVVEERVQEGREEEEGKGWKCGLTIGSLGSGNQHPV